MALMGPVTKLSSSRPTLVVMRRPSMTMYSNTPVRVTPVGAPVESSENVKLKSPLRSTDRDVSTDE